MGVRAQNIKNVYIAGTVSRKQIAMLAFDKEGRKIMKTIFDCGLNDKSIFQVIVTYLKNLGINLLSYREFLIDKSLSGKIGNVDIPDEISSDKNEGIRILRGISRYDIGQSLIIQ